MIWSWVWGQRTQGLQLESLAKHGHEGLCAALSTVRPAALRKDFTAQGYCCNSTLESVDAVLSKSMACTGDGVRLKELVSVRLKIRARRR